MQRTFRPLNIFDHSRDSIGMTYVYPVVSRRSGGISIGINLNPNNACNWRCIYCQVPELKRGAAPTIDLVKLETELRTFLHQILHSNFIQENVSLEARTVNDIALSGNGEPTSAREFKEVIDLIGRVKKDLNLPTELKLVLITNGSLIDRLGVQDGLRQMARLNGEIWFKLDSATRKGRRSINNTQISLEQINNNLQLAASLCPTWLQTCIFQIDGIPPTEIESSAYIEFIEALLQKKVPLKGVMLYGLARLSMQPEAPRLKNIPQEWMESFGNRIRILGLPVKIDP